MWIARIPAPFRFLLLIFAGWMVLRIALSYPAGPGETVVPRPRMALPLETLLLPDFESFAPYAWRSIDRLHFLPASAISPSGFFQRHGLARPGPRPWPRPSPTRHAADRWHDPAGLLMMAAYAGPPPGGLFRRAGYRRVVDAGPGATGVVAERTASRWSGSAWLFVRNRAEQGSLAAGGQLGGSQAGARITYRLNAAVPTRLAAAARISTPLETKGAEAAVGLDWYPHAGSPVRLSIERRVRLETGGRDAWSVYAAGGFYKVLPGTIEFDGYAQAGIVGAHSRDMFADGAIRGAKILPLAGKTLLLGGGIWGAAQPGASRLDIGPRAALRLPVADTSVTLALEGRLRIAGRARPGSGLALTIATDF